MTGTDSVLLKEVIVHKIGNLTRGGELKLSAYPLLFNDESVEKLLTKYFAMEDEFDIHLSAVKKQAKVFKTVLKLDKSFIFIFMAAGI